MCMIYYSLKIKEPASLKVIVTIPTRKADIFQCRDIEIALHDMYFLGKLNELFHFEKKKSLRASLLILVDLAGLIVRLVIFSL